MALSSKNRLIVGSSEHCPDLLYATRFFVPDDIIWFTKKGKSYGVFSPLEIDRARKEADIDHFIPLSEVEATLKKQLDRLPTQAEILIFVLKQHGIKQVEVPSSFPLGLADVLRKAKITVTPCEGEFFPKRQIKRPDEIKWIAHAQKLAEAGLLRGLEVVRAAKITGNQTLRWGNAPLTSELLRGEIDAAIMKLGGLPAQTIVACGKQSCDPHERGHGILRAGQTIILDIFPRHQATGYFGDLTRTVVKGRASEKIRHLYATVEAGQQLGLKTMKPGVDGKVLHEKILSFFEEQGYKTEQQKGRWVGFFHGTGHSLGLEIHEPPRFGKTIFKAGHVMTVEPGLYYPDIGGVRLEDLVVLKAAGIRNLTSVPRKLEIT